MKTSHILLYIAVMAIVTYLIRAIPMVVFRKKIQSRFIQSFLYYVPYTVLAAMTFPAVWSSTASVWSSVGGCIVAVLLAYCEKGLLTVATGGVVCAFLINLIGF